MFIPTTITALKLELKKRDKYFTNKIINEILDKGIDERQTDYYKKKKKVRILQSLLIKTYKQGN